MYQILKKAALDSENVWAFYTENGVLFTTNTLPEATTKLEELAKTTAISALRLVQVIDFTFEVDVAVVEPEPEP